MTKEELPSLKKVFKEGWQGLFLPIIILLPFVLDYFVFHHHYLDLELVDFALDLPAGATAEAFGDVSAIFDGNITIIIVAIMLIGVFGPSNILSKIFIAPIVMRKA